MRETATTLGEFTGAAFITTGLAQSPVPWTAWIFAGVALAVLCYILSRPPEKPQPAAAQ